MQGFLSEFVDGTAALEDYCRHPLQCRLLKPQTDGVVCRYVCVDASPTWMQGARRLEVLAAVSQ